jgi:NADH-quinone oxidoreductase subunit J
MPGGDFHPWLFAFVAVWVLLCGLGVVLFRKITYSAVSMVFCFLGVAFAYALLNAPLVAIVQILVYVGAISIVIIFAIMLTEVQSGGREQFFNRQTAIAAVVALIGVAILAAVALSADIGAIGDASLAPNLRQIARALFDRYVFPFELVSLVLISAMIGAIVLATRGRERS